MHLEAALRDLARAVETNGGARGRDANLRAPRQVLVRWCMAALGMEAVGQPSIASVIRLAIEAPTRAKQRACAVLLVHALLVPGLVPATCGGDLCALMEGALRDVLLRCEYPFGGALEDKMRVLQWLHATIGDLMEPLQPTFPNWQGLYAG